MQSERYDLFKRAKLRKESLRRIVNHALSQSVPASVVTTINGFTKVFAGEIVEKARTVQAEWAVAYEQASLAQLDAGEKEEEEQEQGDGEREGKEEGGGANGITNEKASTTSRRKQRAESGLPPNPHLGQLLPSHIREALRRYKRDAEGGGVGFSGMSMENLGVKGTYTWNSGSIGGRRLFR